MKSIFFAAALATLAGAALADGTASAPEPKMDVDVITQGTGGGTIADEWPGLLMMVLAIAAIGNF